MRTALVLFLLVSGALAMGCETSIGSRDPRDGARPLDAGSALDGAGMDGGALPTDGGPSPTDAFVPPVDAFVPPIDSGSSCTPTRTEPCMGELECGAVPNGCPGGSIDCGECSGGETFCARFADSPWHSRVYNCTQMAQADHPEWFDRTRDCASSSWFVWPMNAAEYIQFVRGCADGRGAVCIVDPNSPENEIRCRGDADDLADNLLVRTNGTGCTVTRYTSTCTPSGF